MGGWMDGWEWSIGRVIVTRENRSTQRKTLSQCHFLHHKTDMDWFGVKWWWRCYNADCQNILDRYNAVSMYWTVTMLTVSIYWTVTMLSACTEPLQCWLSAYTGLLQRCQHVLNRYNADCQNILDRYNAVSMYWTVTMLTVSMYQTNLLKSQTDVMKVIRDFYIHVTVHRNKFLYNKTNQMH